MRLVRYNPLNELALLRNSFNTLFTDPLSNGESKDWSPAVDIFEDPDSIVLNVDLPGVKKEDILVNIEEKVLTISGEKKSLIEQDETGKDNNNFYRRERVYGSFTRSFTLSPELVTDEVDADFKNGVLKIIFKKNKTKETVKQITIN